ncbi:hypothetical protein HIM_04603 [Hirsutella minnesotensis 3608]|uniref:Mitochondrial distribution and morphology protein 12 n=1 Tax=Hirsutella minnesotensis 3608 TaxID=1043627 RepID=A0A0F8A1F2_9HYPO|nr:hypothetical protein HIM_04603 [Hirsutella minnesotensis 3608]
MSIDLNWETLTSGPDGDALAERIRTFIHDKFQTVPLPRFIRSVNVHGFDFGSIPPELELKDIADPLPDFYEQDLDDDDDDDDDGDHGQDLEGDETDSVPSTSTNLAAARGGVDFAPTARDKFAARTGRGGKRPAILRTDIASHDMGSPFLGTSTPGILGGPGRNYFQGQFGTGSQTPLAAVAGAQLGHNGWMGSYMPEPILRSEAPGHGRHRSQSSISVDNMPGSLDAAAQTLHEKSSVSTLAPTSINTSRPPTRDLHMTEMTADDDDDEHGLTPEPQMPPPPPRKEPRVEDVQAVFRIRYAGDIRLNLTAEILLDYPMPSFVGIPIKLSITGLSFDGVGVLAHIRKRVHFCFLSPDDAMLAVGPDDIPDDDEIDSETRTAGGQQGAHRKRKGRFAGLLQEVKVESEIGERDGGKQSLKNVGKVERFVLEQVRRIFEEEFVYPSFWTFLV